jgi:hypothetical protein
MGKTGGGREFIRGGGKPQQSSNPSVRTQLILYHRMMCVCVFVCVCVCVCAHTHMFVCAYAYACICQGL